MVINLAAGTYTLVEDAAPQGYQIADPIVFKIDDQGHVQIKKGGQWEETTDFSAYEAYTNRGEYGDGLDGSYVDNIYVRPIGGAEGAVAYCFNYDKLVPEEFPDSLKAATYTKREEKDFLSMTNGSLIKNNDQLVALIKSVLWKGYPNNQAGLQGNLSNEQFRALTQAAVWLFTNNVQLKSIPYFQRDLSAEEQRVYNELTATLSQSFQLNVYESSNPEYQNIVSTNYVKGPEKVPEVKMEDAPGATPLEPAKTNIKVKKEWQGQDAAQMPEITVYLVKNGQRTDQSLKLNAKNNWSGTFTDLPTVDKITDKTENDYSVEEDGVNNDQITLNGKTFTAKLTGSAKDGYTLTNTYQPTEKAVTFSKVGVNQTKELVGANLKVVEGESADGKVVKEWTSTDTAQKVSLKEGTYTMVETQAPAGYAIAEAITFRVTHDGAIEVKENGNWVARKDATVKMEDALAEQPNKPGKPEPNKPGKPHSNKPGTGSGHGRYPQTGENMNPMWLMTGVVVVAGAAGALFMWNKKQK